MKTKTLEGVTLEVSVPQRTVIGNPIELTAKLVNGRTNDILVAEVLGWPQWTVTVLDSDGKPCRATPYGRKTMGAWVQPHHVQVVSIGPKSSKSWSADLNKGFELKPGRYSARVTLEFNSKEPPAISAEDVKFEVASK